MSSSARLAAACPVDAAAWHFASPAARLPRHKLPRGWDRYAHRSAVSRRDAGTARRSDSGVPDCLESLVAAHACRLERSHATAASAVPAALQGDRRARIAAPLARGHAVGGGRSTTHGPACRPVPSACRRDPPRRRSNTASAAHRVDGNRYRWTALRTGRSSSAVGSRGLAATSSQVRRG